MTAGRDGRVLSFQRLPRGPLRFAHPELRALGPVVDLRAARGEAATKIMVLAACMPASEPVEDPGHVPEASAADVRFWVVDRESGDLAQALPVLLRGHAMQVRSVDLQQARGVAEFALSSSEDCTARMWDLQVAREIVTLVHRSEVTKALFFPGSALLVTACSDRAARVWDLRSSVSRAICTVQDRPGLLGAAASGRLAVAAEGRWAAVDDEGEVQLFDVPRCGARSFSQVRLALPEGGGGVPTALQFALGGRYLACACDDGDLYSVSVEDLGMQVFEVQDKHHKAPIRVLHSAPFGRSRTLLAYGLSEAGMGFGLLREVPGIDKEEF